MGPLHLNTQTNSCLQGVPAPRSQCRPRGPESPSPVPTLPRSLCSCVTSAPLSLPPPFVSDVYDLLCWRQGSEEASLGWRL